MFIVLSKSIEFHLWNSITANTYLATLHPNVPDPNKRHFKLYIFGKSRSGTSLHFINFKFKSTEDSAKLFGSILERILANLGANWFFSFFSHPVNLMLLRVISFLPWNTRYYDIRYSCSISNPFNLIWLIKISLMRLKSSKLVFRHHSLNALKA